MKISAIIVDDEPVAHDILKNYINAVKGIELKGAFYNAIDATEYLQKDSVQLIFLDIEMPVLSGFGFIRSLPNPPQVIFTTAYPDFAVEGFEIGALDYLLKPFSFERFVKAINKFKDNLQHSTKNSSDSIFLSSDKKIHQVKFSEILYLESWGDYVKVHLESRTLLVHDTLQKLMEKLPPNEFIRIHKSFAISLSKIDLVEGNMIIINQKQIPIGQTYRQGLLNLIK
jgi:two-component system, LytTR family, response regulator LytT